MIKRGNTAISRNKHSKPYKHMIENNIIHEGMKILDFGCGRGFDVEALKGQGYNIYGYDKFQPLWDDKDVIHYNNKYDLITCNYVMNVIEEENERWYLLETMKGLSNRVILSVRADKKAIRENWKKYNDGYITNSGTFQKFYDLQELERELGYGREWNMKVLTNNSNEIMVEFTRK